MAALFDEIVASLANRVTVRSMAEQFPGADVPAIGTAAVLGVPAIVASLRDSLVDQGVSEVVLQHLSTVEPVTTSGQGVTTDAAANRHIGSQIINMIFGNDGDRVAGAIATETGLSQEEASAVLPTSAWVVLASVARQYGNHLDNPSLVTILDHERRDLVTKGWAQWIEKVSPQGVVAEAAPRPSVPPPVHPRSSEQVPSASGISDETQSFADRRVDLMPGVDRSETPPPEPRSEVRRPSTLADNGARTSRGSAAYTGGAAASTRSAGDPDRWSEPLDDGPRRSGDRPSSNRRIGLLSLLAGALLMLGALSLIGWFQSRGDADSTVADGSDVVATDDDAAGEAAEGSGDAATDSGDESAAGDDSSAGVDGSDSGSADDGSADPGPVEPQLTFSIPMNDPLQRSDAVGVFDLEFDVEAGQICYEVETTGVGSPYDGHIHVGPAGVKGSIVVDFGPLNSGEAACTDVARNDIAAILAVPANHYVEMHDPVEDFTIRAQMSDDPIPAVPPGSVDFDPNGDGAATMITAGRIVLEGPVPDQETMDRLIAEVAGLDESRILVVNDLVVTEGADLPTGLITVADSILFEVDSDELDPTNTVIEDLALLFNARENWTMTIVGHTDSSGLDVYNLELSLRRAAAVRDSLTEFGVDASRLRTEGAGSRDAVDSNETEAGRAQNRRIEFRIDRN